MADNDALTAAPSIDFNYIKSASFRVAHADGVYGGISPHGYLHMAFYTERPTIPIKSRLRLKPSGVADGPEEILESKGGFTREVEVDVVMNLTSLVSMHQWLGIKLEELRKSIGMDDPSWEKMKNEASAANPRG